MTEDMPARPPARPPATPWQVSRWCGRWCGGNGRRVAGVWQVCGRCVAGGRGRWPWQVAGGRWQVAGGRWPVAVAGGRGRWQVACHGPGRPPATCHGHLPRPPRLPQPPATAACHGHLPRPPATSHAHLPRPPATCHGHLPRPPAHLPRPPATATAACHMATCHLPPATCHGHLPRPPATCHGHLPQPRPPATATCHGHLSRATSCHVTPPVTCHLLSRATSCHVATCQLPRPPAPPHHPFLKHTCPSTPDHLLRALQPHGSIFGPSQICFGSLVLLSSVTFWEPILVTKQLGKESFWNQRFTPRS